MVKLQVVEVGLGVVENLPRTEVRMTLYFAPV
jgi:hypothetical protein